MLGWTRSAGTRGGGLLGSIAVHHSECEVADSQDVNGQSGGGLGII